MYSFVIVSPFLNTLVSIILGWFLECIRKDGIKLAGSSLREREKRHCVFRTLETLLYYYSRQSLIDLLFRKLFLGISFVVRFRLFERDTHFYGMDLGIHLGRARAWIGTTSGNGKCWASIRHRWNLCVARASRAERSERRELVDRLAGMGR